MRHRAHRVGTEHTEEVKFTGCAESAWCRRSENNICLESTKLGKEIRGRKRLV